MGFSSKKHSGDRKRAAFNPKKQRRAPADRPAEPEHEQRVDPHAPDSVALAALLWRDEYESHVASVLQSEPQLVDSLLEFIASRSNQYAARLKGEEKERYLGRIGYKLVHVVNVLLKAQNKQIKNLFLAAKSISALRQKACERFWLTEEAQGNLLAKTTTLTRDPKE